MSCSGNSNEAELNHILTETIMLRRRKQDVLKDLPDKIRVSVPCPIDGVSRKVNLICTIVLSRLNSLRLSQTEVGSISNDISHEIRPEEIWHNQKACFMLHPRGG